MIKQANGCSRGETRLFAVGALTILLLLSTASMVSALPNWDVSGKWDLHDKEGTLRMTHMDLHQEGEKITGTASQDSELGEVANRRGVVTDGFISKDHFAVNISWNYGDVVSYDGYVEHFGIIKGSHYLRDMTSSAVRWESATRMKRQPSPTELLKDRGWLGHSPNSTPAPKATPVPKTIHHTGKGGTPLDPNNPVQKKMLDLMEAQRAQAGAQGVPTIKASPRTVSIPAGQSEGTTSLTWDGGSEHPYAEVWVQAGDEDAKFVVEKGKGTRQVKVEAGQTYIYILTDSGKRLATVTVTGK